MTDQPTPPLSPDAIARREALRDELLGAVRARRVRRRAVAAIAGTLPLLALAVWVALPAATRSRPAPTPRSTLAPSPIASSTRTPAPSPAAGIESVPAPSSPTPSVPAVRRVMLSRDASVVERFRLDPSTAAVERLSDEALVGLLTASGYRPSLLREGSRVHLALGTPPPPPPPGSS